jgi:exopolysaccharide biosynthesis polyprenyl glycosylphosphotransferase
MLGFPELRPSASWVLVLVDMTALVAAGGIAFNNEVLGITAAVVAGVWVTHTRMLHRSRLNFSVLEEIPVYVFASVMATLSLVATRALLDHPADVSDAVLFAGTALGAMILLRVLVYVAITRMRRGQAIAHPVIVVGADEVGKRIAEALIRKPAYGLDPVGIIESSAQVRARDLPVPLLGTVDALPLALTDLAVQDVIFAHPEPPDHQTGAAVRDCLARDCQVFVVPRFFEVMGRNGRGQVELVGDVPLLRLQRHPVQPHRVLLKRLLDITVSLVALVLALPVMLLCALAVRIEGGPGVLFRQTRIGAGGRPFTLLKFRSMAPATEKEGATTWSITHDPRVGPVGRFLRRSSLDELPQLLNVLRGDMSLVGPRPERPHFVQQFSTSEDRYLERHRVPVGLTGWAQINDLRGDTPIDDRVRFDNYYIENWTLWGDVKIILRTVHAVLRKPPDGHRPFFEQVIIPEPLPDRDTREPAAPRH